MSYFDPFPTIEAAPSEPPFHYCRFNTSYLSFILGALQDSIDQTEFWAGSTAEIGEMLQKVDTLYAMLMQEAPPAGGNTVFLPSQIFEPIVGAWTKNIDPGFGARPQLISLYTTPRPEAHAPLSLSAGDYKMWIVYGKFATGSGMEMTITDGITTLYNAILPNYAPGANPHLLGSADITVPSQFDGYLMLQPVDGNTIGLPGNVAGLVNNFAFQQA